MNKPKAVIFDLGDTILKLDSLDWTPANEKLLSFAKNTHSLTPQTLQEMANKLNADFEQAKQVSMIEQSVVSFYRTLFETVEITLSISYEEAAEMCWNSAFVQSPEDGIYEVLEYLQSHDITTGILSNCAFSGKLIEMELKKHNLDDRFPFVISSADYGIRKPHPRIFEIALRKTGTRPEDTWFIGNKPEIDVKGAVNAGLQPVWYNRPCLQSDHGMDCLEINHWSEFIDILDSV